MQQNQSNVDLGIVTGEISGLTFDFIRKYLQPIRNPDNPKKMIPERTLYFWMERLQIETDEFGFYHMEDLVLLERLVRWLKHSRSIERFLLIIKMELNSNAS